MPTKRGSQLPALDTAAANDYVFIIDTSTGKTKRVLVSALVGIPDLGWSGAGETWTYSSYNSTLHTGVITVPSDATTKYSIGMWVRFSQTTGGTKWGKITAVTATTLTVQMSGNATTFNNETVTNPSYSPLESPAGAPDDTTFVYSYANASNAGGTFYFENNRGKKFLYGSSGSLGTSTATISFPTGFFSAIRGIAADAHGGYSNTNVVYGHIETHGTTGMGVCNFATAGSAPSNPVNVKVWGI